MKRDIKFRAWDGERFTFWGFGVMLGAFAGPASTGKGNPMTMIQQQFTGIKDKNGKEIYEGDIIKFDDYVFPVEWGEYSDEEYVEKLECWVVDNSPLSCLAYNTGVNYQRGHKTENGIEIIGNIYENPELLSPK